MMYRCITPRMITKTKNFCNFGKMSRHSHRCWCTGIEDASVCQALCVSWPRTTCTKVEELWCETLFTWPSLGWSTIVPPQYPEAAQHLCSASWWHWWQLKDLKTLQPTKAESSCAATREVFTYYSKDGGRHSERRSRENWLIWLIASELQKYLFVFFTKDMYMYT